MTYNVDAPPVQPAEGTFKLDLPQGVPPLASLYIYVAGGCNLACRHCYITPRFYANDSDGLRNGLFIKLEHVRKAIQESIPMGLASVKLTGGEPTIHPQFKDLLSLIHDFGISINIETNGMLIDDDLAEHMRATQVGFISVSLDGAKAETHEFMRGVPGSFNRAVNGIRSLVKAGFRPQMICTLHQGNVAEIEEVIALAQNLGCGSMKFNIVQRMGRGERFAEEHGLDVARTLEVARYIERDIAARAGFSVVVDVPIAFHLITTMNHDRCGRCAVQNILGLLSSGELSLCGVGEVTNDLVYGHIERDTIGDVWVNSPGLQLLREQVPAQLEGICAECIHADHCLGHCVAQNLYIAGKLNAAYTFCRTANELGLFPASRKR